MLIGFFPVKSINSPFLLIENGNVFYNINDPRISLFTVNHKSSLNLNLLRIWKTKRRRKILPFFPSLCYFIQYRTQCYRWKEIIYELIYGPIFGRIFDRLICHSESCLYVWYRKTISELIENNNNNKTGISKKCFDWNMIQK